MPTMSDEELASMAAVDVIHSLTRTIDPNTGRPCDEMFLACVKKTRELIPDEDGHPFDKLAVAVLDVSLTAAQWSRDMSGEQMREADSIQGLPDGSIVARWTTNLMPAGERVCLCVQTSFTDDNPAGGTVLRDVDHIILEHVPRA